MEKIKEGIMKLNKNKCIPFLIIILFSCLICLPLVKLPLSSLNEFSIHYNRGIAIKEVIESGIFPPLINPRFANGFGYALNVFYGPITTYFPILFSIIMGSVTGGVKIFTLITVILSGIFMYNFTYFITKNKKASLIASLLYIVVPYKYLNIYSRNAVGEYTATMFLPPLFHGLYSLIKYCDTGNKATNKNYYIIISAIGLVLSHTITTIYAIIFVTLTILVNYKVLTNKKFWLFVLIDIVVILLITSFYIVTIMEYKNTTNYTIFNKEIMKYTGEKVVSRGNDLLDWIIINPGYEKLEYNVLLLSIPFLISIFARKKIEKENKKIYYTFIAFTISSLFMTTKYFPWKYMPDFLRVIQFPWRMHSFSILFASFIAGINIGEIYKLTKNEKNSFIVFLIGILTIILVYNYAYTPLNQDISQDKLYEKYKGKISSLSLNREYLPEKAFNNIPYIENRIDGAIPIVGEVKIVEEEKEELHYKAKIENVQEKNEIELPFIFYPGYDIRNNGKTIEYYETDKGFIGITAIENGEIEVKYRGTKLEYVFYIVSLVGIVLLIVEIQIETKIFNKKERSV